MRISQEEGCVPPFRKKIIFFGNGHDKTRAPSILFLEPRFDIDRSPAQRAPAWHRTHVCHAGLVRTRAGILAGDALSIPRSEVFFFAILLHIDWCPSYRRVAPEGCRPCSPQAGRSESGQGHLRGNPHHNMFFSLSKPPESRLILCGPYPLVPAGRPGSYLGGGFCGISYPAGPPLFYKKRLLAQGRVPDMVSQACRICPVRSRAGVLRGLVASPQKYFLLFDGCRAAAFSRQCGVLASVRG